MVFLQGPWLICLPAPGESRPFWHENRYQTMSLKRCFSTGIMRRKWTQDRVQSMKDAKKSSVGLRKVIPSQQEKSLRGSRKKIWKFKPMF